jgi:hypothetical protein
LQARNLQLNFTFTASPATFSKISVSLNGPTATGSDFDIYLSALRSGSFVQVLPSFGLQWVQKTAPFAFSPALSLEYELRLWCSMASSEDFGDVTLTTFFIEALS